MAEAFRVTTYTCWIGSISSSFTNIQLEQHFTEKAKSMSENFHSCKVMLSKSGANQCFINYLTEEDAISAAGYFNGSVFDKQTLVANYRKQPPPIVASTSALPPIVAKPLSSKLESQIKNFQERERIRTNAFSDDKKIKIKQSLPFFKNTFSDDNKIKNSSSDQFKQSPKRANSVTTLNRNKQRNDDYDDDDDNNSSNDESDAGSVYFESGNNSYCRSIDIHESKFLEFRLREKLDSVLKLKQFNGISYDISHVQNRKLDLRCQLRSNDAVALNEISKRLILWKVIRRNIQFKADEAIQLEILKSSLIDYIQRNFARKINCHVNQKYHQITLRSFDGDILNEAVIKIKQFCYNRIQCKRQIEFQDESEYELIAEALKEKEFRNRFDLKNLKLEFIKPSISVPGKVIISGKLEAIEKAQIEKLKQIHTVMKNNFTANNYASAFVRFKLKCFKEELLRKFLLLKYSVGEFKVYGFDYDEVNEQANEIKQFINDAKSRFIDLGNAKYDMAKIKVLVDEFKKSQLDTNESDDTGLSGIDISLNEASRKIFINGTDADEINEVEKNIRNLLNGSIEKSIAIRIPNLVYSNMVQTNYLELFPKYNKDRLVRITGDEIKIKSITDNINKYSEILSKQIMTISYEVNKFEYAALLNNKKEIKNIEKETKTLISIDDLDKYASLNASSVNIELYCGDLTMFPADAYVNPANVSLKNDGGLAKAIINRAGRQIQDFCEAHIRKNGEMKEGDVFLTYAGDMALKTNSIIIHTIGPIWRGGSAYEAQTLAKAINSCLTMASGMMCESIIIPPVSTGIYNYPVSDAFTVISDTVLEYISTGSNKSLKKIIFISNEEETAKEWESVLHRASLTRNIPIKLTSKPSANPSRWYWKDWKAYTEDNNQLIHLKNEEYKQSNSIHLKSKFPLTINKKNYCIDLNEKLQTNTENGFVHVISNEIPIVSKYQWKWLDDKGKHSPYSTVHSESIETAYLMGKEHVDLSIKRHDNDKNDLYRFVFKKKNEVAKDNVKNLNQNARGHQINMTSGFARCIFREEIKTNAEIDYPEDDVSNEIVRLKQVLISGFGTDDTERAKVMLAKLVKDGYVKETISHTLSDACIERLKIDYCVTIVKYEDRIIINGMKEAVDKSKFEIMKSIINTSKIKYPEEWIKAQTNQNLERIQLKNDSQEYKRIFDVVSKTIPNAGILKIERIQNKWLWKLYRQQVEILKDKVVNENEKWLFHGTSNTEPEKIYNSEIGFDMRFSNSGMWGTGIYFAVNASYSKDYAYKNKDGTNSMFYARVALGEVTQIPADRSRRIPPVKPLSANKRFIDERYDSIQGHSDGSDIFILYENARAYPEYLITFK